MPCHHLALQALLLLCNQGSRWASARKWLGKSKEGPAAKGLEVMRMLREALRQDDGFPAWQHRAWHGPAARREEAPW